MKNIFKYTASQHTIVVPNATPIFAPVIAPNRSAPVVLLLLATLLFLVGCKSKHTITEKTIINTDSTAILSLNDSLYKKEIQIANLQIDLQRLREENIRLSNETSTHQISYDTSAPVNPQTGKPPIASELITISKSTLEQNKKKYETLLQSESIEKESLTKQNRNLQLSVEKLTNENKQLSEKTNSPGLNLKLFLAGLILGVILSLFYLYRNM
jgi:FtsZ-binding cell division protein ZapB